MTCGSAVGLLGSVQFIQLYVVRCAAVCVSGFLIDLLCGGSLFRLGWQCLRGFLVRAQWCGILYMLFQLSCLVGFVVCGALVDVCVGRSLVYL